VTLYRGISLPDRADTTEVSATGGQQASTGSQGGQQPDIKFENHLPNERQTVLRDFQRLETLAEWCSDRCLEMGGQLIGATRRAVTSPTSPIWVSISGPGIRTGRWRSASSSCSSSGRFVRSSHSISRRRFARRWRRSIGRSRRCSRPSPHRADGWPAPHNSSSERRPVWECHRLSVVGRPKRSQRPTPTGSAGFGRLRAWCRERGGDEGASRSPARVCRRGGRERFYRSRIRLGIER